MIPEDERELLERRARELARPLRPPSWGTALELITFALGSERYAIESEYVRHVFRLAEVSRLPGAQPPVFGVTAWRGSLLTLLDLRAPLGTAATGLGELSRVLVLGRERAVFGVLADAVEDLVTLPESAVRSPAEGVAARRQYVRGITEDAVIVLDAAELLRIHG